MAKSKCKLDLSLGNLLTCAVYAVIGILLCILKGGSLGILMTVVGALFVVLGVVDIFKNDNLIQGIIEIAVGIAIIVCGWIIADVVLLVFGILLLIKGILAIIKDFKKGFTALIPAIVNVVIGVLLIVAKWALLDVMCLIAGIIFIVNAVLTLFGKSLAK